MMIPPAPNDVSGSGAQPHTVAVAGGGAAVGEKQWRPFPEAVLFARSLWLVDAEQWAYWSRLGGRPADIPASPAEAYGASGWQGWAHGLGDTYVGAEQPQPQQKRPKEGQKAKRRKSKERRRRVQQPSCRRRQV